MQTRLTRGVLSRGAGGGTRISLVCFTLNLAQHIGQTGLHIWTGLTVAWIGMVTACIWASRKLRRGVRIIVGQVDRVGMRATDPPPGANTERYRRREDNWSLSDGRRRHRIGLPVQEWTITQDRTEHHHVSMGPINHGNRDLHWNGRTGSVNGDSPASPLVVQRRPVRPLALPVGVRLGGGWSYRQQLLE